MDDKEGIIKNLLQELKKGTLVMSVLLNSKEATYGYALVHKLQECGVDIEQNTLYPLLRRLEKQELLVSYWDTSESRPRKYYTISPNGQIILQRLIQEWSVMNGAMSAMISKGEIS